MTAVAWNDVWAVGTQPSSGIQNALIEHRDGTSWSVGQEARNREPASSSGSHSVTSRFLATQARDESVQRARPTAANGLRSCAARQRLRRYFTPVFGENPCNGYSAVVASAMDIVGWGPGEGHPGKIGSRARSSATILSACSSTRFPWYDFPGKKCLQSRIPKVKSATMRVLGGGATPS